MNTRRKAVSLGAAGLALCMCVTLGACEGQLPEPVQATASASASPNLTTEQEKAIRKQLLEAIEQCNNAKSADGLDRAMSGPELEIRRSELAVAQKTGNLDPKTDIPDAITQTIIPTDSGWPRSVFTITTTTQDQQSKRLLVFDQESARQNYKLWGVARLFQGVQMPKFTVPQIGAQMGTDNDDNLKMTPKEAVKRYADVLQNGDKSQYAGDFDNDYLRQELATLSQTVQQGMERNKGTQTQTFEPVDGQMRIMRAADGGDLVVAQINSVWTRAAGEGRESQPASDSEKALFGDAKATSTMRVTYVNVVALYIPPAKANATITAVGAERQPVKVEAI